MRRVTPPSPEDTLLVIGHPGHELRLWGWVSATRPVVCVLTDGSGSTGHPRLTATRSALENAGAVPRPPFGSLTDTMVYDALLDGAYEPLLDIAEALTSTIVDAGIHTVVSDAIEGYNPTHDVCGLLARAAVDVAAQRGKPVDAFVYDVVGPSRGEQLAGSVPFDLDDQSLAEKLELARAYAREAGAVLAAEVDQLIERDGRESFRSERLLRAPVAVLDVQFASAAPFFETHGERRVREGKYARALRLREHLVPFEQALTEWARSSVS